MRYLKTFEQISTTTISIKSLITDCIKYDIDFFEILKEMTLNRLVTFQCDYKYNEDNITQIKRSITGRCEDIKIYNEYVSIDEWNILIKMNNEWYELTNKTLNNTQQLTIYCHNKGNLEKELELEKNKEKYNL